MSRIADLWSRGVVRDNLPTDHLMFCTDDKSPEDILKNGCIDHAIRIAVSCGLDPVKAIQMATVNTARHFGLAGKLGAVAPGRYADFVLFEDLKNIEIKQVYFSGKLVAENGKLLKEKYQKISEKDYPALFHSVHLPPHLCKEHFMIKTGENTKKVKAVVIEMLPEGLRTKKHIEELTVANGIVQPDVERDILPVVVIDRYTGQKNIGKAMIHGLGIKRGAVASSTAQEGNNVVVSGTDYDDMLQAVRAIEAAGGGSAVCIDGTIIAFRNLPIAGIIGNGSLEEELECAKKFQRALKDTGSSNPSLMAMLTVSLCPSIPEIGLTDMGVIENGEVISSVLEEKEE